MLIISVDPGNVTGVDFYLHSGEARRHETLEVPYQEVGDLLVSYNAALAGWHAPVHVAVERYTMTPGVKTAQPYAIMVMGVVEDHARRYGWRHRYYSPAACKNLCDNRMLRALGWWAPTKDGHKNDARRVTLTCMANVFPQEFAALAGI